MNASRVLIVDDEEQLVQILRRVLVRRFSVEVDTARDGRSGVDHAAQHTYDLIISDIRMPQMDGISMLQHIRCNEGPNRGTPAVLLTGHHDEGKAAATALGAHFVAKPFSRQRLCDIVGELLPAPSAPTAPSVPS